MLLITCMQAVLPFITKAVIDVGIQTQDVSFINIVLMANLALIVSITLSAAVRDWILQHMSSRINIALISLNTVEFDFVFMEPVMDVELVPAYILFPKNP